MIVNTNRVREINNELIRNALKNSEYSTKNSISKETGLSISTCRNILEDMLKTGEAKEVTLTKLTGGRPSRHFVYNKSFAYVGIVYLRIEGNDYYIYSSVLNMLGESVYEATNKYTEITYQDVDYTISKMTQEFPQLQVVSIGIPGIVIDGYIGLCDVIPLRYTHLRDKIEEKYKIKVVMDNDVNVSALGLYNSRFGNAESIAYLYFPEKGIPGVGIVVNGKVIRGATNFAGEIGFLPFGVEYDDYGKLQEDHIKFFDIIVKTVLSINCIINPMLITISWKHMCQEYFDVINDTVKDLSPEGHAPKLIFNSDHHNDYINGLTFLALKEMSCKLEVIERC